MAMCRSVPALACVALRAPFGPLLEPFWDLQRRGGQRNYGTGIRNTGVRPAARQNQYTLPPLKFPRQGTVQ
jgi:hypothetical protein